MSVLQIDLGHSWVSGRMWVKVSRKLVRCQEIQSFMRAIAVIFFEPWIYFRLKLSHVHRTCKIVKVFPLQSPNHPFLIRLVFWSTQSCPKLGDTLVFEPPFRLVLICASVVVYVDRLLAEFCDNLPVYNFPAALVQVPDTWLIVYFVNTSIPTIAYFLPLFAILMCFTPNS